MKVIKCKVSKKTYDIEISFSGKYDYSELMSYLNKKYDYNIDGLCIIDFIEPTEDRNGFIFGRVKFVNLGNTYFPGLFQNSRY